ncbi:MAG: hypothetical protein AB1324_00055 [Candidatus Micrarchaeota archaeon]
MLRSSLDFRLRSAAYEGSLEKQAHREGARINGRWTALDFSERECHRDISAYLRKQGGVMGEPILGR